MEKECKYCKVKFQNVVGRVFSNHVRWCDKNPSRNNTENIKLAVAKSMDERYGKLTNFNVVCNKCDKTFVVIERELSFPLQDRYYCSIKCSHSRDFTIEQKKQISDTIKQKIKDGTFNTTCINSYIPREHRKCLECNIDFEVIPSSDRIYCSKQCFVKNKKSSNEFLAYKNECRFKFNVWHYPEEFNLDLIKKHGWYKAANHGNNLTGVSRDHRISVRYGWENKIPASIIAHPANCELMQHTKNSSKHSKCSVQLEQLVENIQNWDKKYTKEML